MLLKLAAFADEISPNLDDQIRVCHETGVTHFELRSVDGINVLDFDQAKRTEIRAKLKDAGIAVACIGSPIGKVKMGESWSDHFDRFKVAVEMAEFLDAPLVRIFSYYPRTDGEDMARYRDEIVRRMVAKTAFVKDRPVTLVHENEKAIYGDKPAACLDLLKSVDSPKFRCAFDFANFVQVGVNPLQAWPLLKPYTVHFHIKDALNGSGQVVPAGEGDGHLREIVADAIKSGYSGFISIEPHLASAGQFSGFSGPDLFKKAVQATKVLCAQCGIEFAKA